LKSKNTVDSKNYIEQLIRNNLINLAKQRIIIEMNKHIRGDKTEDITDAKVVMTTTFNDEVNKVNQVKRYKIA